MDVDEMKGDMLEAMGRAVERVAKGLCVTRDKG